MTAHTWTAPDGTLQAIRTADGWVTEMRRPPYVQLYPCPYCDTTNAEHDKVMHLNTHLRTTVMVTR